MKKYRVRNVRKEGYYNIYRVESRFWLIGWEPRGHFNTLDEAKGHIEYLRKEDRKPKEATVYKE